MSHPSAIDQQMMRFVKAFHGIDRQRAKIAVGLGAAAYIIGWFFVPVLVIGMALAILIALQSRPPGSIQTQSEYVLSPLTGIRSTEGGRLRIKPRLWHSHAFIAPASGSILEIDECWSDGRRVLAVALVTNEAKTVRLRLATGLLTTVEPSIGQSVQQGQILGFQSPGCWVDVVVEEGFEATARPDRVSAGRTPLFRAV